MTISKTWGRSVCSSYCFVMFSPEKKLEIFPGALFNNNNDNILMHNEIIHSLGIRKKKKKCTATYKTDCVSGVSIPQPRGKHLWLLPGREPLSLSRGRAACPQITLKRTCTEEMRGPTVFGKGWAQREEGATAQLIYTSLLVRYMSAGSHYVLFIDHNSSLLLELPHIGRRES